MNGALWRAATRSILFGLVVLGAVIALRDRQP